MAEKNEIISDLIAKIEQMIFAEKKKDSDRDYDVGIISGLKSAMDAIEQEMD